MKDTNECPKCTCGKIYKIIGSSMNMYQKVPLNTWSTYNGIVDRYICSECGYMEEYVQLNPRLHRWASRFSENFRDESDDFV